MSKLRNCLFGACEPGGNCAQFGYAIFRLSLGAALAYGHGWGKFSDPSGPIGMVEQLGFPAPVVLGWCLILTEFIGAILVGVGLFTRPAAFAIAIAMGTAWYQHFSGALGPDKMDFAAQEKALLFFIGAIAVLSFGSGKFGLDRLFRGRS